MAHIEGISPPTSICLRPLEKTKKSSSDQFLLKPTRVLILTLSLASSTYPLKLQALGKLIFYRHIAHVTQKVEKLCF